ncbi:hypothetical protein [Microvirga yunnanensis]|uniref:hypothetical protein n=1 Tax=Microvirga yunnanensis TaxID=2953740 RepID=UPI0021C6D5B5|nr:hypothetical protein [Microvirga sp. HBU67655]
MGLLYAGSICLTRETGVVDGDVDPPNGMAGPEPAMPFGEARCFTSSGSPARGR